MWAAAWGMPGPLSPISTRARSPSRAVRTVSRRCRCRGERSWANPPPMHFPTSQRLLPGCAAFHPAPVTTHHTQPEPHQRPKERRHDRVPPQRPGEGPEQELESDPIGVLDDEDQEDPEAGERRDRPATQFAPIRLLPIRLNRHHALLMWRSTGGFGATVSHLGGRLLWRWLPAAVQPRPRPVVTP